MAGTVSEKATLAAGVVSEKAIELKDAAVVVKDDISDKLTELDRMLEQSITDYNDAYTLMNDKGVQLFVERTRTIDQLEHVENLVNSIANKPKSFETEIEEIETNRKVFKDSCEFAQRELQLARKAAGGAGAGLAAGTSVAFMAPTAAMWIATTFGTASTGTAISTLSGAAATNAALAWLGGGAAAAGGGGMAAGNALLALAGPVGWTIAGATLLTSILLFTRKRTKLNKEKNAEIETIKKNTERVKEVDLQITAIYDETISLRDALAGTYKDSMVLYGTDYMTLDDSKKQLLGSLVNYAKSVSVILDKAVEQPEVEEVEMIEEEISE